jgi:hypothetical protein
MHERFSGAGGVLRDPWHARRASRADALLGGKLDFHALRVAYVKLILESDADVKDAQTLARHATPEITLGIRTSPGRAVGGPY